MPVQPNLANRIKTAQDLHSMQNALKLLSEDRKNLLPERLREVTHLGPSVLQAQTGFGRTQLYKRQIPLRPSTKLAKNIFSLVIATDLAFELLSRNQKETETWMMAPNTLLFGESPFEVCMRGESQPLIKWLQEQLGFSEALRDER